jgi:hypothetical protein
MPASKIRLTPKPWRHHAGSNQETRSGKTPRNRVTISFLLSFSGLEHLKLKVCRVASEVGSVQNASLNDVSIEGERGTKDAHLLFGSGGLGID